MSHIVGTKLERPDLPAGSYDQIWSEQISQFDFRFFVQYIDFRVVRSVLAFLLLLRALFPSCLFLPHFFLCSYPKNLDGPVMGLDGQVGLRWVECYLRYTVTGGEWESCDWEYHFGDLGNTPRFI